MFFSDISSEFLKKNFGKWYGFTYTGWMDRWEQKRFYGFLKLQLNGWMDGFGVNLFIWIACTNKKQFKYKSRVNFNVIFPVCSRS